MRWASRRSGRRRSASGSGWRRSRQLVLALGPDAVFARLAVFFSQMAVVTFGGAYAVLAYVAQAAEGYGWVTAGEMLDGLGMAETTPGPLIMVVQFVGFLAAFRDPGGLDPWLAGVLASVLVTWVTFVPSFLWIFLGAPWIERLRGNRGLAGALAAITAAVVGVILNLALWFGLNLVFRESVAVRGFGLRPRRAGTLERRLGGARPARGRPRRDAAFPGRVGTAARRRGDARRAVAPRRGVGLTARGARPSAP